ncbi:hypothetical protein [Thalassobacillus sp. CUG 92003]|uniref:hypothetical protein n=1 Tax=Thalassobacillus sp. CUG 92003 TaxID=2736641 RepID=UPI0015E7DF4B|nr:hypothetical protein [Thalassobacillus sp. CUG 92003]
MPANEFTKRTEAWDNTKIWVGDVIKFPVYDAKFFGKPFLKYYDMGVVTSVEAYYVVVFTKQSTYACGGMNPAVHVSLSDKIEMVFRHPKNTGEVKE